MIINIQEARHLGGQRLWLRFNTGETGEVDLRDLIERYPIAAPLRDAALFADFYLDSWPTVAWPCGFDMAPEALYSRAKGQSTIAKA